MNFISSISANPLSLHCIWNVDLSRSLSVN